MKEWIDAKRKEITAQRDQAMANFNACNGYLQALEQFEEQLNQPIPLKTSSEQFNEELDSRFFKKEAAE